MLFLSLGSNYAGSQAFRHLFTIGRKSDAEKLQKLLVDRYQGKKALLYSKGRGALAAAVRLATGGSGKVAVTSLTCYSVIDAVEQAGSQVVYVEISPKTLQFDAHTLAETLKKQKVKAIIVQNTVGIPLDIDAVMTLAKQAGASVIEDLAHSAGAKYADGREVGTIADYTMLSFGRDKLLDTINGGALVIRTGSVPVTLQPPIHFPGFVQQLRDRIYPPIGWLARTLFPVGLGKYVLAIAYKLKLAVRSADGAADSSVRLPHWQAHLALVQMQKLDETVASRLAKQQKYLDKLSHLSMERSANGVRLPLLVENRDEVVAKLKQAGFYTEDIWYDVPVSPERLYHLVDFPEKDFPVVSSLTKHVLNLPTHQLVTDEDIDKISQIVSKEARPWS